MSIDLSIPAIVPNQMGGHDRGAADDRTFSKMDPATGRECCRVARSSEADVNSAVECARKAQPAWASTTVVKRGEILGVHILGAEATEQIAEFGLGKTLEATVEEVGHTVHAHPTMSEAVMEAALDAMGQAIHL